MRVSPWYHQELDMYNFQNSQIPPSQNDDFLKFGYLRNWGRREARRKVQIYWWLSHIIFDIYRYTEYGGCVLYVKSVESCNIYLLYHHVYVYQWVCHYGTIRNWICIFTKILKFHPHKMMIFLNSDIYEIEDVWRRGERCKSIDDYHI